MDLGSMSEEFSIGDRGDNGGISRGIESCGICSGFVMDRGVLDCCDHWFCFSCIDNWAGITNICPMCKNEFQLITCVPVFDTIGNNMIEEDSFLRDDDWSIQGENNTLYFPSYYIDENAVICLDGDGCKIRTGAAETENNSLLDTSIACDSCDLWYHAFCVDFVAEATSESSWLCPRCVSNKEDRTPNTVVTQDPGEMVIDGEAKGGGMPEASFTGKVSITVADAGETAVVVSMVDGEPKAASSLNSMQPTLLHKLMEFSNRDMENKSEVEPRENSHEAASAIAFQKEIMPPTNRLISHTPEDPIHLLMSSPGEVHLSSNIDSYEETSVDPTLYENATGNSPSMKPVTGGNNHQFSSKDPLLPSDMSTRKTNLSKKAIGLEGKPEIRTSKRKYLEYISDDDYEVKGKDDEVENENSAKKYGSNRSTRKLMQHQSSDVDGQLEFTSARKSALPDIMNIVREGKRHCKGSESHKSAGETSEGKENMNGLRVKKIMRRAVEDKDSLSAVQKLRQEIKEAMQNKTSMSENDLVNEKLLTAFRAAIAGPGNGHMMKSSSTSLKSKNPILQKGRARENLTRKIYATGTGRRRRASDREREVEFWKHRCMHTAPEKVETLKSVLDLLKRSSDSGISVHEMNRSDIDGKDSILSRLYLADASVFPRKEDIKPVAVLPKQDKGVEQENKSSKDSCPVQEDSKTVSRRDKDIKVDCLSNLKNVKNSSKAQGSGIPNTHLKGSSTSGLPKQNPGKSTGSLVDKKKWALEVLARKNASTNKGSENQEDNAKLKGNYPLLAQLPSDMRPEIIIIPRSKVPLSIRQAQLYRLSELFLSKTNMPVIRRTAETELAIADAVNVEKEICETANSKSVYRNLCSLAMSRHKSVKEPIQDDNKKEAGNVVVPCDIVEKALKLAGLDSDSPPSSPDVTNDTEKNDNCNLKNESEAHESIFDLDPQSDFDIYGDFEYDLDDDVYAGPIEGANTYKTVKESDLKIKVVLSKVAPLKAPDTANHRLEHVGEKNSSCMVELKSLNSNHHAECPAISSEKNEEISLADCQDLYGMEKEPLSNQYIFDAPIVETIKSAVEINRNAENGMKKQTVVNKSACDNFCMEESVAENMISKATNFARDKQSDFTHSVANKVEAYVKEHIRPLCKSGVISVEQYRWAVAKTTEKVMKFHLKEKNANFLIKEGDKVKKLAEQYVEASQDKK